MAGRRKQRHREWARAFSLIRHALSVVQSDAVQAQAHTIPPEEIGRIQEVVSDLQEVVVDLERSTEERFYCN
jgi:hypothetical protein